MPKTIGIDFGTSNSLTAVIKYDRPAPVANLGGDRTTPSVVAINPANGELMTGIAASRQSMTNPQNTIFNIKRLLGRKFYDLVIQDDLRNSAYSAHVAKNGGIMVDAGSESFTPMELASILFKKLKEDAAQSLGEPVEKAVVSVPACYYYPQRQVLMEAAEHAGLHILRLINEPTAAALSYASRKQIDGIMAVCHMGAGSLAVSILKITRAKIEVIASSGESLLGGLDIDQKIMRWILEEFHKSEGVDLQGEKGTLLRIAIASEKVKRDLTTLQQTEINLPYIPIGEGKFKDLSLSITREKLVELAREPLEAMRHACERVLVHANLKAEQVNTVITTGQQARMPAIQEVITHVFGAVPRRDADPVDEAAQGAALLAGIITGELKQPQVVDITPLDLSLELHTGSATAVITKNSPLPARQTRFFTTTHDDQTGMDFKVYQGNAQITRDNILLGSVGIRIPPAPKGAPQLEVGFMLDEDGLLSMDMTNKATGSRERLVLTQPGEAFSTGRKPEEIKKSEVEKQVHALEKRMRLLREHLPPEVEKIVNDKVGPLHHRLQQDEPVDPADPDVKRVVEIHDCIGLMAGGSSKLKGLEQFIKLMSAEEDNHTRQAYVNAMAAIDRERTMDLLTEALQNEENPERGRRMREALHFIGGTGGFSKEDA